MKGRRTTITFILLGIAVSGIPLRIEAQVGGPCQSEPSLRSADCNGDDTINLTDGVCLLIWLFQSGVAPACLAGDLSRSECDAGPSFYSADCNGDDAVNVTDGVCLLTWLFQSGAPPRCVKQQPSVCGDGTRSGVEVCDDGNALGGDDCNPTCTSSNTTELFAGTPRVPGLIDDVGSSARFGGFGGLWSDEDDLWVADAANNVIRRIDMASREVETVAGDAASGSPGYHDDPDGRAALFSGCESITSDGVTLWIGDGGNRRIRAMSLAPPHAVSTVSGSGRNAHIDGPAAQASFQDLRGVTYHDGVVYLLDSVAATLRRMDPATGDVTTVAGSAGRTGHVDGPGARARFESPRYMASDGETTLYISDTNGAAIRTYNTETGEVGTFAGNGVQGYVDAAGARARVHRPRGITFDGESVYWVEFNQHTVRQGVLSTGDVTTMAGRHCGGGANCAGGYREGIGTAARFTNPFGLAYHEASGTLFVLDGGNSVIRSIR